MFKKIITHNGTFHADEVSAIALLSLFNFINKDVKIIRTRDVKIIRTRDEKVFEESRNKDIFIDVGGVYDGKLNFDHHQAIFDKSSAGMIWDFIKKELSIKEDKYPEINQLIKEVDDIDLGRDNRSNLGYSAMISSINNDNIYNEEQEKCFLEAVNFSYKFLRSLKIKAEKRNMTKKEIKKGKKILKEIFLLPDFVQDWSFIINGENRSDIKAVVWFDKKQKKYLVQVSPIKYGSFELYGDKLNKIEGINMEFIHVGGFFAVGDESLENMIKFLKKNNYQ